MDLPFPILAHQKPSCKWGPYQLSPRSAVRIPTESRCIGRFEKSHRLDYYSAAGKGNLAAKARATRAARGTWGEPNVDLKPFMVTAGLAAALALSPVAPRVHAQEVEKTTFTSAISWGHRS